MSYCIFNIKIVSKFSIFKTLSGYIIIKNGRVFKFRYLQYARMQSYVGNLTYFKHATFISMIYLMIVSSIFFKRGSRLFMLFIFLIFCSFYTCLFEKFIYRLILINFGVLYIIYRMFVSGGTRV